MALGTGDILLTSSDTNPATTIPAIAFDGFSFLDIPNKRAVLVYQGCDVNGVRNGKIYHLTVTTTETTVVDPFGIVTVNTGVTWTQAATDFAAILPAAKTFAKRLKPGT